jgi:hypothetical protein
LAAASAATVDDLDIALAVRPSFQFVYTIGRGSIEIALESRRR